MREVGHGPVNSATSSSTGRTERSHTPDEFVQYAIAEFNKIHPDVTVTFSDGAALLRKLDNLEDYALAASYADARSLAASGDAQTQELLERGRPIRKKLLAIAEALVFL